jgi:hypothetical protein
MLVKIMIIEDRYVNTSRETSRWLTCSSFLFVFPAFYAYTIELYSYSALLVFTSLVSANFWRKPDYSWRRDLDLVVAKISFVVFTTKGAIHARYTPYVITGFSSFMVLCYCYYLSEKHLQMKHDYWYKYHLLFHAIMTYELFFFFTEYELVQDVLVLIYLV